MLKIIDKPKVLEIDYRRLERFVVGQTEVSVSREATEIHSLGYWYPDISWRWKSPVTGKEYQWVMVSLDQQGYHTGRVFPEIRWVVDTPADDESPEAGHYETTSGELISPGMRYTGPVTVWQISPQEVTIIVRFGSQLDVLIDILHRDDVDLRVESGHGMLICGQFMATHLWARGPATTAHNGIAELTLRSVERCLVRIR